MKSYRFLFRVFLVTLLFYCCGSLSALAQVPVVPPAEELSRSFGEHDRDAFRAPSNVFYPQTWFHYISGNVSLEGITADLEAIAEAGISGIQLFHGQFGGPWPGVEPQIACLSPLWDNAVKHTAEECKRLGLRFTMQNCPGWAMSGGPWIEPKDAMRHLAWSRTDVNGGAGIYVKLPVPQPSEEDWRDYRDVTVLAFPTPLDDTDEPLQPVSFKSNREMPWDTYLMGRATGPHHFPPAPAGDPYWVEVTFRTPVKVRTLEFPSINSLNHGWCFEPGVSIRMEAVLPDGTRQEVLAADLPQSNWQDDYPISYACPEVDGVKTYRITITNQHDMALGSLRLFSGARKNNWQSEAGWTLRTIERTHDHPQQSPEAYIDPSQIVDITGKMDGQGNLNWEAPPGRWTVLRIGHVNTGMKNGPAPPEGTGFEVNKLSKAAAEIQFANYIGRLSGPDGPVGNGLLQGMLMDSWECKTQTWTEGMEQEFARVARYELRHWLPAVLGYVIADPETTARFLIDWRATIGDLFSNNFYGHMATLAHERGLSITYETAAGDVFPADIMDYFKHADVPMCEFWQPLTENFVGSLNFKPIKPTASAARLYGKPRVAAESFTSFSHTWDEHWSMLREVANVNSVEGVSHMVFHTYTHNASGLGSPGTSFAGSNIGTPFLKGQTWWKHMPEFTGYLARCSYMLERGKPVSDVLWYLGDEINHKPDQQAPFPAGFKYDYCNPDVLLNRLSVEDGRIVTPEGIRYRVLWLPEAPRMLPQTLEKLHQLLVDGATIVGNAPTGLATLSGGKAAQQQFERLVREIWGKDTKPGVHKVGKGTVLSGLELGDALLKLGLQPDVTGGDVMWAHRATEGADWYFVCAPQGAGFTGTLDFRNTGAVERWDPLTGKATPLAGRTYGNRTSVSLELPQAGSCFVVFRHTENPAAVAERADPQVTTLTPQDWTLTFPEGWGAPASLQLTDLKPWAALDLSPEGKAFSGSAVYTTSFTAAESGGRYRLDLGRVDMIAAVSVNGTPVQTLWTPPYAVDITEAVQPGVNTLRVEVTSTWFNRLAYDAARPEAERKTWVMRWPDKNAPLRESGLMGPVTIRVEKE